MFFMLQTRRLMNWLFYYTHRAGDVSASQDREVQHLLNFPPPSTLDRERIENGSPIPLAVSGCYARRADTPTRICIGAFSAPVLSTDA